MWQPKRLDAFGMGKALSGISETALNLSIPDPHGGESSQPWVDVYPIVRCRTG